MQLPDLKRPQDNAINDFFILQFLQDFNFQVD